MKNVIILLFFFSTVMLISCTKEATSKVNITEKIEKIENRNSIDDPLFNSDVCEYYTYANLCPACMRISWSVNSDTMMYKNCEVRINYRSKSCCGHNCLPYFFFYIESYDVLEEDCLDLSLINIDELEEAAKIHVIKNTPQILDPCSSCPHPIDNFFNVGFFESSCSSFCVDDLQGDNDFYWVKFEPLACEGSTCCSTLYSVESKAGRSRR